MGLYSVFFSDANNGTTVGYNGKIHRTTNGGTIFINQLSNEVPDKYFLSQNYPNPFNPSTKAKFSILEAGFVTINVYDALGKEVANLLSSNLNAGVYETDFDGSGLAGGIYFLRLGAENFNEVRKMVLAK